MTIVDFELDPTTLEIFPKELYQDDRVAFHATSSFHSEFIEEQGFIPTYLPFLPKEAEELTAFLRSEVKGAEKVIKDIESYVQYRLSKVASGSFGYHSGYCCLWHANGPLRGGQGLHHIRVAEGLIRSVNREASIDELPTSIQRLFAIATSAVSDLGVVYAVKFSTLDNITQQSGGAYSSRKIEPAEIVAKTIVPVILDSRLTAEGASKMNTQKMRKPDSLRNILMQKEQIERESQRDVRSFELDT